MTAEALAARNSPRGFTASTRRAMAIVASMICCLADADQNGRRSGR